MPALLLTPERPSGAAVVVHHQHHAQWHLGKSEVAGLDGDRWQAFGPALARRGVTVMAHDAVGFEDRRPGGPGLDPRVAFAVVSGSACTYRERMARGVGIECSQAIPGLLELADLDEIAPLVAPRPLLMCSADDDKYSADAPRIAAAAERTYRNAGVPEAFEHRRAHGGHALDEARFGAIVDWVAANSGQRA